MRTIQCARAGWLTGVLGACVLFAGVARADVFTERPGSILIFPKVVNTGGRTTVIQITNTGNMPNAARCFYLNGQADENGQPLCTETDFDIELTRQQPTWFDVDTGRGLVGVPGLSPGLIPPVPAGFTGALICVEVDTNGAPSAQNKLKGEATIGGPGIDESKYNALAIQGGTNDKDTVLDLDGSEYSACPAFLRLNIIPFGAPDPIIEAYGNGGLCGTTGVGCNTTADCAVCESGTPTTCLGSGDPCTSNADCVLDEPTCATGLSRVSTALTLIPCNIDLETARFANVSLHFDATNEFEEHLSASIPTLGCFGNFDLGVVGLTSSALFGAQFATVLITPSSPVLGVAESQHTDSVANVGYVAVNVHTQGVCDSTSSNAGAACNSDPDCTGGGFCTGPDAQIRIPPE